MKAFGYLRASTDKQAMSPEVQREKINFYYKLKLQPKGYEWGGFYEDPDTSSSIPLRSRPAGCRLCVDLAKGDAVCFAALDRAFRNTVEALEVTGQWDTQGVSVHFLDMDIDTSTAIGRLFFTMSAAYAEMERRRISERTKEAFDHRKRHGQPVGTPRYGWRLVGRKGYNQRIAPDHEFRKMIRHLIALYESGYTLHQLVLYCAEHGIKYQKGSPTNPRYEPMGIYKIRSNMIAERRLQEAERVAKLEGREVGPYDHDPYRVWADSGEDGRVKNRV